MNGIDGNGDGVIDIRPTETSTELANLDGVSNTFAKAWTDALKTINNPGKVGIGPMGEAFKASYEPQKKSLVDSADAVDDNYGILAGNGRDAVRIYLQGEQSADQ